MPAGLLSMLGALLGIVMLGSLALLWFKRVQASRLWFVLMGVFVSSLAAFVVLFAITGITRTQDDHKSGVCYGTCSQN
jgi:hypothetical protein